MPQMALHSSLFARISATTQDLLQKNTRPIQKELSELLTPQQLAACPQEFVCPISLDIMRDPVLLLPTGQIYDFYSLTQWFESGEPFKMLLHGLHFSSPKRASSRCPQCCNSLGTVCGVSRAGSFAHTLQERDALRMH